MSVASIIIIISCLPNGSKLQITPYSLNYSWAQNKFVLTYLNKQTNQQPKRLLAHPGITAVIVTGLLPAYYRLLLYRSYCFVPRFSGEELCNADAISLHVYYS